MLLQKERVLYKVEIFTRKKKTTSYSDPINLEKKSSLYINLVFRKNSLVEFQFNIGLNPLKKMCTRKQIKQLCQTYSKETGTDFTSYYDAKFLEWLENSNPTEDNKKQKNYTFIETSKFVKAIMEAYMTSMNEVSQKLDNHMSKESYTKQEVVDIVFEAFNSAKTIGEGQIKNLK